MRFPFFFLVEFRPFIFQSFLIFTGVKIISKKIKKREEEEVGGIDAKERKGRSQRREIKWRQGGAIDFQIRASKSDLYLFYAFIL